MEDIGLLSMQIHLAFVFTVLRPPQGGRLGFIPFLNEKKWGKN